MHHLQAESKDMANVKIIDNECFLAFFKDLWGGKESQVEDDSGEATNLTSIDVLECEELYKKFC